MADFVIIIIEMQTAVLILGTLQLYTIPGVMICLLLWKLYLILPNEPNFSKVIKKYHLTAPYFPSYFENDIFQFPKVFYFEKYILHFLSPLQLKL